ncbi:MAG: zinc ABC transporter substrate-binding protein [Bacilli bacterium]|nr:zinc ABC transporter substrate-binding protein [Bacilli bacterium]
MKRLILTGFILFSLMIITTGCVKKDSMEDIDIITSSYPIEYLVNRMYGNKADIQDIFPDSESIDTYKLNNKELKKYSNRDLFIYNGNNASNIALELSNRNHNILLIDSTRGMNSSYGVEELWLDPSNMLMMALNIKTGLQEYITNNYLIDEINNNYQDLKIELSELDADYKLSVENAPVKTLVVTNESLGFLEKYGLTIIVLNDETLDKTYNEVRSLIYNKTLSNIYMFDEKEINEKTQKLIDDTKIKKVVLDRLDFITDEQRKADKDYMSIMEDNLDLIKNELYK